MRPEARASWTRPSPASSKAIELDPKFAMAHNNLGNALADQGPVGRGHRLLPQGHRTRPEVRHGPHQPGRCAAGQGPVGRGHRLLQEGHRTRPEARRRPTTTWAMRCWARASWTRPSHLLQEGHRTRPEVAVAHGNLGNALRPRPVGRGHRLLQEGHRTRTEVAAAQNDLGGILCESNAITTRPSPASARPSNSTRSRRGPQQPGQCAAGQGPVRRGHRLLTARPSNSTRSAPRPTSTWALRSRAKGQLDEAIACYRKAIELDPKNATAHSNLGNALRAKGQLDEAIACYKKAIELDPKPFGSSSTVQQPGRCVRGQGPVGRGHRLLPEGHRTRPEVRHPPTTTWAMR